MSALKVYSTVEVGGYTIAIGHRGSVYEVAVFRGEVGRIIGRGIALHELDHVVSFYDELNATVDAHNFITEQTKGI